MSVCECVCVFVGIIILMLITDAGELLKGETVKQHFSYDVIITLLSRYYHVIITLLSRYYRVVIDCILQYYRLITRFIYDCISIFSH